LFSLNTGFKEIFALGLKIEIRLQPYVSPCFPTAAKAGPSIRSCVSAINQHALFMDELRKILH
jgi:hypothetical protein